MIKIQGTCFCCAIYGQSYSYFQQRSYFIIPSVHLFYNYFVCMSVVGNSFPTYGLIHPYLLIDLISCSVCWWFSHHGAHILQVLANQNQICRIISREDHITLVDNWVDRQIHSWTTRYIDRYIKHDEVLFCCISEPNLSYNVQYMANFLIGLLPLSSSPYCTLDQCVKSVLLHLWQEPILISLVMTHSDRDLNR